MNRNTWIIIVVLLIVLLLIWWWWPSAAADEPVVESFLEPTAPAIVATA